MTKIDAELMVEVDSKNKLNNYFFKGVIRWLAISFSVFQLYFSTIGIIGTIEFRAIYLLLSTILILSIYPLSNKKRQSFIIIDVILIIGFSIATYYLISQYENMSFRTSFPSNLDILIAGIVCISVFEITRRTMGWAMPLVALMVIFYALYGNLFPGMFGHAGYSLQRILMTSYVGLDGIYGTPIGVTANMIFIFVVFGSSLEISGAGDYFLKLARLIAGHLPGGPAKMSVIASAFFGSISGSAVANTVGTGSLTIPLMKKSGYKPHVAGAIEAAASTGGQMLPPVMGAGAFLISEFTGTPYINIVIISIIPALLYFGTVYFFVDLEAKKEGIKGIDKDKDAPSLSQTLLEGIYYIIPIIILIIMFAKGFTVARSAGASIIVLFAIMLIRKDTRGNFRLILDALEDGAKKAIGISAAAACAGLIVGLIGLTGVGLKFSSMMMGLAGNNLFLALILVGIASFILGMGLSVVAAYIILVVVAGPGLEQLGIPILTAHLVVFWYSQLSNVTPPVCLAAFAGAGIAGADPNKTGYQAIKASVGLIIIPLMMVYKPALLLNGSLYEITLASLSTLTGLLMLIALTKGFLLGQLNVITKFFLFVCIVTSLLPNNFLNIFGLIICIGVLVIQRKKKNKSMTSYNKQSW